MTRSHRHNSYGVIATTAGALVLATSCVSAGDRVKARDSLASAAVSSRSPDSGITAEGRSFGPLPTGGSHLSPSQIPDLVAVVGDHHVLGYADSDLLLGDDPADSPAEALGRQESRPKIRKVPVYATDGTTIVDIFTVSR